MKRICLLGASRGLGWSTYQKWCELEPDAQFLLVSRKIHLRDSEIRSNDLKLSFDFTKQSAADLKSEVSKFKPTHLVYLAGGGPYGPFLEKNWKDHLWSLKLNFLFPAEFAHLILAEMTELQSITFIGSLIAENSPDAFASSYAAGKHALKGLITTLQAEKSCRIAIKLFSPGYMATDLLPPNSAPRLQGYALSPEVVAQQLIKFIESPSILGSAER